MTADDARRLALSLPDVVEQDHHGRPSFRVKGKIIATLWTPEELNVMVEESRILSAVDEAPETCERLTWGGRLEGVKVRLPAADPELVGDLLREAHERRT